MATFWTEPTWKVLHIYSLVNTNREAFNQLLHALAQSMPCPQCRLHLKQYLEDYPLSESQSLFKYSVDLHNDVNKRLNKPVMTLPEAKKKWLDAIKSPAQPTLNYKDFRSYKTVVWVVIVISLLLLVGMAVIAIKTRRN